MSDPSLLPDRRLEKRMLIVAGVALGVLLILAAIVAIGELLHSVLQAYLIGYLVWWGAAVGSLALWMVHSLTGGRWGHALMPVMRAAASTLPLVTAGFLPVLLGMGLLYDWTNSGAVAGDHVLHAKAGYLNVPFFIVRTIIYFAVWNGLLILMKRGPYDRDRKSLAAPGLVLYVLTVTLASVDWAMSLDPHWMSSIYGLLFIVGQVVLVIALLALSATMLAPRLLALSVDRLHDVGNFMLMAVTLWAYINFSQFLIIWYGNLPEEITWYVPRMNGHWQVVGVGLIVLHFFLPFFILLSRQAKRKAKVLRNIAIAMIVLHIVDMCWRVGPSFEDDLIGGGSMGRAIIYVLGPVIVGGLWMALFVRNLRRGERTHAAPDRVGREVTA